MVSLPPGKNDLARLKEALDTHEVWPSVYVFKFIVPQHALNHLLAVLDGLPTTLRDSKTGKYTSVTIEAMMPSSDDVIAIYEKVRVVEGLMSL